MAVAADPNNMVPYMNTKDCSQGFCTIYCPQWCYIIYPPPPQTFQLPNQTQNSNISPLLLAIIGILASIFLVVTYYTVLAKFWPSTTTDRLNQNPDEIIDDNHNPSLHEAWHATTTGLDEALINSITVCKYKKDDGLVAKMECSVCLSEFKDSEVLRLLPKCSHAFHVVCIDTWLKSHSNCPLCRAAIVWETTNQDLESGVAVEESRTRGFDESEDLENRDGYYDIRSRRSVSMDYSCHVSVADILRTEECETSGEDCKFGDRKRVLNCVSINRSFSDGRFLFGRQERVFQT